MKKTINLSFMYAIFAMIGGVFYREFTKLIDFEGRTALSFIHVHFFLLGMVMMLIVTLFISKFQIQESKKYKSFMIIYNIGVCLTSLMFFIRGIIQASEIIISRAINASISGIAGIGHIFIGIGIILFFLILKEQIKEN